MIGLYKQNSRLFISDINIVPLLDVLLVLILIFISTTSTFTQNIEVDLPSTEDSNSIISHKNPSVIVEVSGIKKYSLLIGKNHISPILPEKVITEAKQYLIDNPKTIFLISGAKDVPYDEIIQVLNLLHKAGVKSVGLITESTLPNKKL